MANWGKLIFDQVDRLEDEIIEIRRDLHQHPEVSGHEINTAAKVAEYLFDLDIEVTKCKLVHGVVGLLKGGKPGPTVALRADMDALPMQEETGLSFASEVDGVMHACGHDIHTAVLMGTAAVLAELREELEGNILFLFQPSEEFFPGGALGMIEEGAIDNPVPDAIFALHTSSTPLGSISISPGPIVGSVSTLSLRILGKGGHFSSPHMAVDPIVVASHVVVALNSMITRRVDPLDNAVLTFGMIQGGTRDNIIGEMVVLRGNIGSLDEALCKSLMQELEQVVKGITSAMGATYKLKYIHGYPTTRNDAKATDYVRSVGADIIDRENVLVMKPMLGGEDMAYFLEKIPGAIFFLGTHDPTKGGTPIVNHDPRFSPDERCIAVGMKMLANLAARYPSEF